MGKRKLGRPTKFKEEYTDLLIEYFDKPAYETRTKKIHTKQGAVIEIDEDVATDFPTLAGFAIKIGVARDTILEWQSAKNEDGSLKHPNFSVAYKRAKDFQENFLAINGNKGLIQANFGIFTAKNVIGWRDKQPGEEDRVIVNNYQNMSDEEIDARIKALEDEND